MSAGLFLSEAKRESLSQACPLPSGGSLAIAGVPWLIEALSQSLPFSPHLSRVSSRWVSLYLNLLF